MMWELFNGQEMAPELVSRHTCHNRWCVNPKHIIPGTQKENIQDMMDAKRDGYTTKPEKWLRGEDSGTASLTNEQALNILEDIWNGMSTPEVMAKYDKSEGVISDLRCERSYLVVSQPWKAAKGITGTLIDAFKSRYVPRRIGRPKGSKTVNHWGTSKDYIKPRDRKK